MSQFPCKSGEMPTAVLTAEVPKSKPFGGGLIPEYLTFETFDQLVGLNTRPLKLTVWDDEQIVYEKIFGPGEIAHFCNPHTHKKCASIQDVMEVVEFRVLGSASHAGDKERRGLWTA